jgi:hypothetical protein
MPATLIALIAQAPASHVAPAASYAVFGGVLASAVVAGLMVQMAVRSSSPELKEYPAHPLGFALALLTTAVLLFTALTARPADVGAIVAFVIPTCLLSAGGVLTFVGIAWLSMGTGAASDDLVNWRVLSRAATLVAATLTWQGLGNAREVIAPDPDWRTSWHALAWAALLTAPTLVSLIPGVRQVRLHIGGKPLGTVLLRSAVVAFVMIAVVLWVISGDRDSRIGEPTFLNLTELVLAGGLGVLFGLYDATLPLAPARQRASQNPSTARDSGATGRR